MHQIARLEGKLTTLAAISRRISWLRLIAFLGGIAVTWAVAASAGSRAELAVFVLASAVFIALVVAHRRLDRQEKRLRIWQDITLQQIARHDLDWEHIPLPAADLSPRLPHDVDLDLSGPRSLHHLLDTAISRQGSARLAAWITADKPEPAKIAARQAIVAELARLPGFRKHLTSIFRQISRQPLDAVKLLAWLQTPYDATRLQRFLPIATPLALVNAVLFGMSLAVNWPPFWALTSTLYGLLYFANISAIGAFLEAIVRLDEELMPFKALLRYLERYPYGKNTHLAGLCAPFHPVIPRSEATRDPFDIGNRDASAKACPERSERERPQHDNDRSFTVAESPTRLLRRLQWVTAAAGLRMNPVIGLLINLAFPWDFWAAWLSARQRQHMARLLPVWLDTFHELEALISLGNFAALNPGYAFPEILPVGPRAEVAFSVRGLGHPLLPSAQKVCNDFEMNELGEVAIITGSNMAGKSTFIRTVGVNLCLAYAGGPVNASAWKSLPFRLYTCIRINDSLGDGFSYFYAEVKRLKGLLGALGYADDFPLLYLIDEIFRGTNNRERLIGSRAYVKALIGANGGASPAGIGLIATHDLELANLVESHPRVHNFHFRDEVQGGKLAFDYQIRAGPSPTTNALKIMQIEGLPMES